MIEHPFLQFDDEGRLQSDLSCIGCGYNLRALRRDGDCPECGAAIRLSLVNVSSNSAMPVFWHRDTAWINRLTRALGWWCLTVPIVAMLVWVAHWVYAQWYYSDKILLSTLVVLLMLSQLLLGLITWLVTSMPQGEAHTLPRTWHRRCQICRCMILLRSGIWLWLYVKGATESDAFYSFVDNYYRDLFSGYILIDTLFLIFIAEWCVQWTYLLFLAPLSQRLTSGGSSLWHLSKTFGLIVLVFLIAWCLTGGVIWGDLYPEGVTLQYEIAAAAQAMSVLLGIIWLAWIYALTWMLWRTLRRFKIVST